MKRLQTIVVVLSLLVMLACGKTEVESAVAPVETPIEQTSTEPMPELQGSDTTQVQEAVEIAPEVAAEEEKAPIPIAHLLWLLVPAVAIAIVGFVSKRKMADEATEQTTIKWLIGSELILYVVELVMVAILLLAGILDACAAHITQTILFLLLFLSLNTYGAFVTNSAILRKFDISFSWKRIFVYLCIAFAVETLFAVLMPKVFDVAIIDSRMVIPNLMVLCVVLCILFGVDMYRQNTQSLRAIPVVFILFTIGVLMSGALVLITLVAIGLWYVIRSCLAKEKAEERRKAALATAENEETKIDNSPNELAADDQDEESVKE